jgi:hypothetical protein
LNRPNNGFHLLIERRLPFQSGVQIIRFVRALFHAPEFCIHDVPGHRFQGLPILFVHGQQEEGHHDDNHEHQGQALGQNVPGQKVQRNAGERAAPEADELPFRQVKEEFGFDFGQVFGYVRLNNVFHGTASLMGVHDGFT